MNKAVRLMDWLFTNPIVILIVFYFYWFVSVPVDMIIWGMDLIGIYLAIVVLQKLFSNFRLISIIILIASCVIMLLSVGYVLITVSLMLDYGTGNITSFFVLAVGALVIVFSTYKKITSAIEIMSKFMFVTSLPLLILIINYFVIYYPTVVDTANFGGFKYYAARELNDDFYSHIDFYKCKKWEFRCDVLYGSHGWVDTKIIVDEKKGEVSLFENFTLQYTDGANPRRYQGYPAQLNNYLYLLGWTCNEINPIDCENVVYVLYQCELDFKSCNPLPVQYIDYYDNNNLILDANETMNEINLIEDYGDEPTLIFTYGENSRCFVDNCEIISK